MRTFFTAALIAAGLALPTPAQTLYVDASATSGGNGATWATAFDTVQGALAIATPGTEVWVAATGGLYSGPFDVPAGVSLIGSFLGDQAGGPAGSVTKLQRTVQNRTVLSGGGSTRVLTMGAGSSVEGFWIQFGQAAAPGGGGVLIDGVDATIRSCFFQLNSDSAGSGAAILVRNGANPHVESCVFFFNGDAQSGATIEVDNASGTFVNLTLDSNTTGGFRLTNGATPEIYNTILSNNGGRGIEQADTSADPQRLDNNLFHGNATSHYLYGASELTTVGQINALGFASGNLQGDPLFEPLPRDYRLQATSPAVDSGSVTGVPAGSQGIYDQSRVLDGDLNGTMGVDMGAAEFSNVTLDMPVDIHRHVHVGLAGTAGLPGFLIISPAPLGPVLAPPVGYVFIDVGPSSITVPYFSIPTPAGQAIDYPPSMPGGIVTYWQALTTNFVGVNLSNPGVHITNP